MTTKGYWLRMLLAWLLLQVAGRVMKDAEQTLKATIETPVVPVLNGEVVEEPVNG